MMGYERRSVCSVPSGTDEESSFRRKKRILGSEIDGEKSYGENGLAFMHTYVILFLSRNTVRLQRICTVGRNRVII